ncbi:TPA: DUF4352 domain-containing protein [Candidatus Bathyarchaeota archaeon]|nr:DUF4352 domain-containing protein [Candidatus Bathyarchaeota archaeon]
MKSRKAISPVIATVILVAVAITIAVAVSYWMSGISSQYTKFEKVEIQSAQCSAPGALYWTITVDMKNTGTSTATINSVYINDVAADFLDGLPIVDTDINYDTGGTTGDLSIASGAPGTLTIYVGIDYESLSSGTAINIKFHSAGGMDYIKLIELV